MANHKSALKRHRQSLKRRDRNRYIRGTVRTLIKKVRAAAKSKDDSLKTLFVQAEKAIAKAAAKGVYPKKAAYRKISRLAKLVNVSSQ